MSRSPHRFFDYKITENMQIIFFDSAGLIKYNLPPDVVWLQDTLDSAVSMIKYFYQENGKIHLFSGQPLAWLFSQAGGNVVINPTVIISRRHDAMITDMYPDYNTGHSSAMQIGKSSRRSATYRSLVKLDLSSVKLPSNATICTASLFIYGYNYVLRSGGFRFFNNTMKNNINIFCACFERKNVLFLLYI